jgi:AcrR family transcriptional regulator
VQVNTGTNPARSITATARRAQIVTAAIDTIAELGYQQASFARIAERAGLSSTRLISYHFNGKDELIGQIVTEVIGELSAFMAQRMAATTSARDALATYISANAEFVAQHRTKMTAFLAIFLGGGFSYQTGDELVQVSPVEEILVRGQRDGEFRDFDTTVMATLVQRAVEGLPFLLASRPDLDPAGYAREVVTTFDKATRSERNAYSTDSRYT